MRAFCCLLCDVRRVSFAVCCDCLVSGVYCVLSVGCCVLRVVCCVMVVLCVVCCVRVDCRLRFVD